MLVAALVGALASAAEAEPHQALTDDVPGNHPAWMQWIPDSVSLTDLSLPGTHDAATFTVEGTGSACKTQALDFGQQLAAGIRVFDIRASRETNPDRLDVDHGICDLRLTFREVAVSIASFIADHPTEVAIVRLGDRGVDEDHDEDAKSWTELFEAILDEPVPGENPLTLRDVFWAPTDFVSVGNPAVEVVRAVPTLGEVRGKIVLWRDSAWESEGLKLGLVEGYHTFDITADRWPGYYNLTTCDLAGLAGSPEYCWRHTVRNAATALTQASASSGGTKLQVVGTEGSTSNEICYIGVIPLFCSGLFPYNVSDDVNFELYRYLASHSTMTGGGADTEVGHFSGTNTGVVWLDYPGGGLIGAIIAHNLRLAPVPNAVFANNAWTWNWGVSQNEIAAILGDLFRATAEDLESEGRGEARDRQEQFNRTLRRLLPDVDLLVGVQRYESGTTDRAPPVRGFPSLGSIVKLDDEWMLSFAVAPPGGTAVAPDQSALRAAMTEAIEGFADENPSARARQVRNELDAAYPEYAWAVTASKAPAGFENRTFQSSNWDALPFALTTQRDAEGYYYIGFGIRQPPWEALDIVQLDISASGPAAALATSSPTASPSGAWVGCPPPASRSPTRCR